MAITFNHTIVAAKDREESATLLHRAVRPAQAPRSSVRSWRSTSTTGSASTTRRSAEDEDIRPQHYAFLVSEDEFDAIYGRIRERGMQHWADPRGSRPGEINHNDGGRGVYFQDPGGHYLEILTRPYGSGAA